MHVFELLMIIVVNYIHIQFNYLNAMMNIYKTSQITLRQNIMSPQIDFPFALNQLYSHYNKVVCIKFLNNLLRQIVFFFFPKKRPRHL